MRRFNLLLPIALLLGLFASHGARAALTIEITGGAEAALPIAIVPFGWQGTVGGPPEDLARIVSDDLARSGRFAPLPEQDLIARPHRGADVKFSAWRLLGTENLVVGSIAPRAGGGFEVQFQLFDVFKAVQLAGYKIPVARDALRRTAHQISDIIYEALTGEKGAFATRIAYVTAHRGTDKKTTFELNIADADGYDEQNILTSPKPLMSPKWSPDGQRLAYVSFEDGNAAIFVQDVFRGTRQKMTDYKGLNGAPDWSPDGTRLAVTLSKDGNPEIYILNLAQRSLQRITRNPAIDTEAVWAPDGRSLVFTSDRGGRPQLYRVSLGAGGAPGRPERLTFEGEYNARAAFSPDGGRLAMVHGNRGVYRIATLELETGLLQVLTDSRLDESPSFAPNGSMIIYATDNNNRGVLAAVSVDGRVHQRLVLQKGDVREPAWSPYRK